MFDVSEEMIGKDIAGIKVHDMRELEEFCRSHKVDMAVLTLPKDHALEVAERLVAAGVRGLWNFTGRELDHLCRDAVVENVHLGDSLMTLCYELRSQHEEDE